MEEHVKYVPPSLQQGEPRARYPSSSLLSISIARTRRRSGSKTLPKESWSGSYFNSTKQILRRIKEFHSMVHRWHIDALLSSSTRQRWKAAEFRLSTSRSLTRH